ncbi:MAG: SDR family oxidoreductase [Chloroflexota bacterium]
MTNLHGKNVLITGCASGIGRLIAQKAAVRGANVILWDINTEGLDKLSSQLRQWGYDAHCYRCDLSNREDIQRTAEQVLQDHGVVDVVVNNAGIVSGKPFLELSDQEIERTLQVNTLALFWTNRAFLPAMLEKGEGHLVTIASAGGLLGASKLTDYTASKFAAVGFDEVLRMELARSGSKIQTTVICPYYTDTGMFKGVQSRFSWLLPILKPENVAGEVINAIEKNRKRVLLPSTVYLLYPLRLLPVPLFDTFIDILGIPATTDQFVGRHG